MEHPTGDFDNALEAMTNAITRLRKLPDWSAWITFSAQGMGERPDSYMFSEVHLLGTALDVGDRPLDIAAVGRAAGLPEGCLVHSGSHYLATALTPRETARLLDAIFRTHGRIRPFPDEDNDYAVGAEW